MKSFLSYEIFLVLSILKSHSKWNYQLDQKTIKTKDKEVLVLSATLILFDPLNPGPNKGALYIDLCSDSLLSLSFFAICIVLFSAVAATVPSNRYKSSSQTLGHTFGHQTETM